MSSELERQRQQPRGGDAADGLGRQPRPPITYLLIYEDARVSMGIFCLPARAKIPLHNHPGMTVLSRCAAAACCPLAPVQGASEGGERPLVLDGPGIGPVRCRLRETAQMCCLLLQRRSSSQTLLSPSSSRSCRNASACPAAPH
jgi:hypothetical protein